MMHTLTEGTVRGFQTFISATLARKFEAMFPLLANDALSNPCVSWDVVLQDLT